ncbi:hypothetical protein YC2023_049313 [Brassica napus]
MANYSTKRIIKGELVDILLFHRHSLLPKNVSKQVVELFQERRIVMAEGVVSFGVEKLWDLLSRET